MRNRHGVSDTSAPYRRLSALGTVLALVAVGAAAVAAPIEPGQGAPLVGAQSGRCLTVPGSGTTNGTQTQLRDCTGAAGQTWTYTAGKQPTVHGGTNQQWRRR
ncbi:RICIN domain-containing protein [Streptomyces sp. 378]|uniref:RICIN domain-containing protein n=1 Tax=Streptomyces sp. 378 TaxID=3049412 RepID=UPI0024C43749|nr:RICIN domain-containing protein [Streptomyces sp. 378]MDK1347652.1 RICIN domain-containing protein [Streptomyces sp. 378]